MLYQFQADDGEVIERNYSMKEAPELGQAIEVDGKVFRRILSMPASAGLGEYDGNDYPRVSHAMPRFLEGAEHVTEPGKNYGKVIIESAQQARELCRRHGFTREYHHTDPQPKQTRWVPKAPWEK